MEQDRSFSEDLHKAKALQWLQWEWGKGTIKDPSFCLNSTKFLFNVEITYRVWFEKTSFVLQKCKTLWSPLVPKIPTLSVDFWQVVKHRASHYSFSDSWSLNPLYPLLFVWPCTGHLIFLYCRKNRKKEYLGILIWRIGIMIIFP